MCENPGQKDMIDNVWPLKTFDHFDVGFKATRQVFPYTEGG